LSSDSKVLHPNNTGHLQAYDNYSNNTFNLWFNIGKLV